MRDCAFVSGCFDDEIAATASLTERGDQQDLNNVYRCSDPLYPRMQ